MLNRSSTIPIALVLCALSSACSDALAQDSSDDHPEDQGPAMEHVDVEVALDRRALAPSGEGMLGVRFKIADEWHLYWRNNGDSGMPIGVTFDAPEGVRIGEIRWPAPIRYVYGAGSVDYIYENEVTLLAQVEVGERFDVGDTVEIGVSFELLACREACVFGMGERSVVIEIAESESMSPPDWIEKSQARIPRRDASALSLRWDGTDLLIEAYNPDVVDRMVFFPFEPREPGPVSSLRDGISETGTLRIAYPPGILEAGRVAGVVEIAGREGPRWIEIETTPPSESQTRGGPDEPKPTPNTQPTRNRSGD